MAVKFNGGFKIGGVEYRHPLSSDEIRYILTILKKCNFKGEELENLTVITMKLQKEYKKVFSMIDYYIFMKIPNFDMVFKWRLLQENKLRKGLRYKKKIKSYNEIKRFIMFYQRITLQMVRDLSKSASIVMLLNKNHEIKKLLFKS